jgi:2-iminobutanoate/2-iminopropanoate deaminase
MRAQQETTMPTVKRVAFGFGWEEDMPLSQVMRAGDTLYLAGQVPLDDEGNVVGVNDLEAQSRQVFRNLERALAAAGAKLTDVVRLTTYFAMELTLESTHKYWAIRREFFGEHKPASTGLQVSGLIYPTLLLEVDAIAVIQS